MRAGFGCGVGNSVRLAAFASLCRDRDGAYEITGNTDLEVSVAKGSFARISAVELTESGGTILVDKDGRIQRGP